MEWNIFKADKKRKKWSIRGQLWDGRFIKLPGHRERKIAEQIMRNIESLNNSKRFNEPPEARLADWIAGLPEEDAKRYVEIGFLGTRYIDSRRSLSDLLDEFYDHLRAINRDVSREPTTKVTRLRRIVSAIKKPVTFEQLTVDDISNAVKGMGAITGSRKGHALSQKSKHEYLVAMKSFCNWMVSEKRSANNPMLDFKAPPAKGAPVRNRRPITLGDFQKLAGYVRTAPVKAANGKTYRWRREDRLMAYWMAAVTGFRMNELKSLTPASIDLESHPATATVEADAAKNKTKAIVPIDHALAKALKRHCMKKLPNDPLLNITSMVTALTDFYRDMDGAGVCRKFADGSQVDFHALRSTAICWWLTLNKLDLLEVKFRARLKTLQLVQQYSQNFQPKHIDVLRNSPRVIDPDTFFNDAR